MKSSPEDGLAQVQAIYQELAARNIERQCTLKTECCQFKLTGKTPYLTKGEALLAAKGLRAAGRKTLPASIEGACPLLHPRTHRCLIYHSRPFGCRTHFCAGAGGPYSRGEVVDLIRRLDKIDAELGGEGPRAIQGAIEAVL